MIQNLFASFKLMTKLKYLNFETSPFGRRTLFAVLGSVLVVKGDVWRDRQTLIWDHCITYCIYIPSHLWSQTC